MKGCEIILSYGDNILLYMESIMLTVSVCFMGLLLKSKIIYGLSLSLIASIIFEQKIDILRVAIFWIIIVNWMYLHPIIEKKFDKHINKPRKKRNFK